MKNVLSNRELKFRTEQQAHAKFRGADAKDTPRYFGIVLYPQIPNLDKLIRKVSKGK